MLGYKIARRIGKKMIVGIIPLNLAKKITSNGILWNHWKTFSSSSLPSSEWEKVTSREGETLYYNKNTRETVRNLSGQENKSVSPINDENALVPINFNEASKIEGHESQIVHIDLKPNQMIRAETGSMLYMTEGIEINTSTGGGFGQGLKRAMTGENFFVSDFTYNGTGKGSVAFGTDFPSKIIRLPLKNFYNESIICQKGAFLCGSSTINIDMEFTKSFGVGFFGGEGFVLQKLSGEGEAFVKASGSLIEKELQPGEVLRISSGCLVAFERSIEYDISMMKGFKNVVFGGEGLFITTLTGPGKVYLQSLPFDRVVDQISRRIPRGRGGMFVPIGMGGGSGSGSGEGDNSTSPGADSAAAGAYTDSSNNNENVFGASDSSSSSSSSMDSSSNEAINEDFNSSTTEEVWNADTGITSEVDSDSVTETASGIFGFIKDLFKD